MAPCLCISHGLEEPILHRRAYKKLVLFQAISLLKAAFVFWFSKSADKGNEIFRRCRFGLRLHFRTYFGVNERRRIWIVNP